MNKAILTGRLTKDPEIRYSQSAEPIAVSRFCIACNRKFKRENEPGVDFINCIAFGKTTEFISKYFSKGKMIAVVGRIQIGNYKKDGITIYTTDINVEEVDFCGEKETSIVSYTVEDCANEEDLPF